MIRLTLTLRRFLFLSLVRIQDNILSPFQHIAGTETGMDEKLPIPTISGIIPYLIHYCHRKAERFPAGEKEPGEEKNICTI
jgi:hypothetical protein